MIDPATLHRWAYAGLFVLLAALVVFMRLLPLGDGGAMPPPDLILGLAFAWVLRRPDYVPVLLFAAILFLTDLLFQRPPGVRAALAVIGLEYLRARAGLLREQSFALEWATVAAVLAAMMLAERLLLGLFAVPQVSFGLAVLEFLSNAFFYPLIVVLSAWAFRVRRLQPGELAAEARLT